MRRVLPALLAVAGLVWLAMFPKRASLSYDVVVSWAIGLGLLGTAGLLYVQNRFRRSTVVLAILLLWSLLGNLALLASQHDLVELVGHLTRDR